MKHQVVCDIVEGWPDIEAGDNEQIYTKKGESVRAKKVLGLNIDM